MIVKDLWSKRDALLLFVLSVINIALASRVFRPGVLADNDFVAHYSYLKYLVDTFYPTTQTHLGWSPLYNTGQPFLLFNTPPLLYVLSGLLTFLGLSPLLSLKLWLVTAFVSVPVLGYALARCIPGTQSNYPICVAFCLSSFSSELYGLDFFLNNGMVNASFALPFLLLTLIGFRRSLDRPLATGGKWLALGGCGFAATILTHLLTAYMAALCVTAFALCSPVRQWSQALSRASILAASGLMLSCYWLFPSLGVSDFEPAVFNWIRSPSATLTSAMDGSIFSSYGAGFFRRFVGISQLGIVAIFFGALGVWAIARRKILSLLPFVVVAFVALWIALGPSMSGPLVALPLYNRLLWYRFVTLFILAFLFLAAQGVSFLLSDFTRISKIRQSMIVALLSISFVWAIAVEVERSQNIRTEANYPIERENLQQVASWLNTNGDRNARIYSEFPKTGLRDAISVNYARHLLPILSGFEELVGWVYENNQAGQELMATGLVWDNPFPILTLYERYNVKYVIARTALFTNALRLDARWEERLTTKRFILFEAKAYNPTLVNGGPPGAAVSGVERHLEVGGGYQINFIADIPPGSPARPLIAKVNYSAYWQVLVNGAPAPTQSTKDGLMQIELPEGLAGSLPICMTWSIAKERSRGNILSILGVVLTSFIAFGFSRLGQRFGPPRSWALPQSALYSGIVILVAVVLWRWLGHPPINLAVGNRDGITTTNQFSDLVLGSWGDSDPKFLNYVDPLHWSDRTLSGDKPARISDGSGSAIVSVTVARGRDAVLTIEGHPTNEQTSSMTLTVRSSNGAPLCPLPFSFGKPVTLEKSCIDSAEPNSEVPGQQLQLSFGNNPPVVLTRVTVDSGITYLEAENLLNNNNDGGNEWWYFVGPPGVSPHNGVMMTTRVDASASIYRALALEANSVYELWVLAAVVHPFAVSSQATTKLKVNSQLVGTLDNIARPGTLQNLQWQMIGAFQVPKDGIINLEAIATVKSQGGVWAGIDAFAFVPKPAQRKPR